MDTKDLDSIKLVPIEIKKEIMNGKFNIHHVMKDV